MLYNVQFSQSHLLKSPQGQEIQRLFGITEEELTDQVVVPIRNSIGADYVYYRFKWIRKVDASSADSKKAYRCFLGEARDR